MNRSLNAFATVRQNRVSKKRNVIGLYRSGRSISLNQLNTDYVDQWYKEQYLILKEQHEQTKQQFNKQQEQLKQLNGRLQRLLEEKKDFLSQFVHYSQVNAGYLAQELEVANLRLQKENKKLKDQLLLAQVRAASANSRTNLGRVMIINMNQHLQTNYGWVKARIDSGLDNCTKRNPISGQLVRQRRTKTNLERDGKRSATRSTTDTRAARPTINKERHRVSFSNQLEQEHLYEEQRYEDDFEQEDEELMDDWSSDDSSDPEESKRNELERKATSERSSERTDNDRTADSAGEQTDLEQFKTQLNRAKSKIDKLEEIVFLQQQFIDRQQELTNQTDHLDSLKARDWFDKENLPSNIEKAATRLAVNYSNLSSNSSSSSLYSSSSAAIEQLDSMRPAGGNQLQIEELNESNSGHQSNKIKANEDRLVSTSNYGGQSSKHRKSNRESANRMNEIDKLSGRTMDEKAPESTKSIFGDDDTTSSSLSSLDQLTLSVLVKQDAETANADNEPQMENRSLVRSTRSQTDPKTNNLVEGLSKQLRVEKVRNEQLESRNRARLRELEHNIDELSKENEILRNSLEKCIQDCLTEIGGSGLS